MKLRLVKSNMEEVNQIATNTAAAGAAVAKSGLLVATGAGVASSLIVMVFLEPQSRKEKLLCFVSTFVFAACLSSAIKVYYGFDIPDTFDGNIANAGLIITCGMPGWVVIRALFLTLEKMKGKDIGQIIAIIRGWFGK